MGVVIRLGSTERHFWLTRSVARTMGLSMSAAMKEGRLSAQGYSEMIMKCRRCEFVDQCEQWLARCGDGAQSAPEPCVNAAMYEALKP